MTGSALAPLAVAAPLVTAALIAALGERLPRRAKDLLAIVAGLGTTFIACLLLTLVAASGTVVHWFGGWRPEHGVAVGIAFVVDPVGGVLGTFAAFLAAAALIFAWTYYDRAGREMHTLMLVFTAALIGFFFTGDLFNLFVFFELMGVAAYALTSFRIEDESAVLGALSFAVINSLGALFVLLGIVLLYGRTGALNFEQLGHALAGPPDPLVLVAFTVITFGFLVKAAIVPAHFWLSEAHAVAPTPLCVLFSGIMVQAGIYAAARLYVDVFSPVLGAHAGAVRSVLLLFGVTSAIVGALMCTCQQHLKRLLAFSTISHAGIMLCAFALLQQPALAGLVAYIIAHGLVKGSLFMSSGVVLNHWKTLDIEVMRGRLNERPWITALLILGAFALAGLPLFATFAGTALIDRGAEDLGLSWLPIVLRITAALTGAAVLRAVGTMAFGWGPRPERHGNARSPQGESGESEEQGVPRSMLVTASVLLACCIALTFTPWRTSGPLAMAQRFTDRVPKMAVTLQGRPTGPLHMETPLALRPELPKGALDGGLALLFAAFALFGSRTRWGRALAGAWNVPMNALRYVHSGIVTDYVGWLAGGVVVFGIALALMVSGGT